LAHFGVPALSLFSGIWSSCRALLPLLADFREFDYPLKT
jgi:hypothetical protein